MLQCGSVGSSAGARGATADDSDTDRPVERHVHVSDRAAALLQAGEATGHEAEGRRRQKGQHGCGGAIGRSTRLLR